jgi:membrane protein YqaA with SNARE-associated domain
VIGALLGTVAMGALSAFVPLTPIEPYLVGLVAATGYPPLPLAVAAAAGQSAGKVAIFLTARGTLRSAWLRRWRDWYAGRCPARVPRLRPVRVAMRRLTALMDRPALTAPMVFVSAVSSLPPLLATSVYAARTRVPAPLFGLACLLGRAVRFTALAVAGSAVALAQ